MPSVPWGKKQAIPVRNPRATRPWQHVLEPLGGYLSLAERIYQQLETDNWAEDIQALYGAFNFGPALGSNRTVGELAREILTHWPGDWIDQSNPHAPHEAKLLNLVTDKAFHTLGWQPVWDFERTIAETVTWYREARLMSSSELQAFTLGQIKTYQNFDSC